MSRRCRLPGRGGRTAWRFPPFPLTVRCVQASGTAHFILDVAGYFE